MSRYELWRHRLSDGEETTIYAVRHPAGRVRVLHFPEPQRLDVWCAEHGVGEGIVAGFFLRDPYRALGEVWIDGRPAAHEPVAEPYAQRRACVISDGDGVRLAARAAVPESPAGHLVQAGPLLVAGGSLAFHDRHDHEGFSAGAGQFDSDKGHLLNRPYSTQDQPAPQSRSVVTALALV